jgi:hypothetical protein
MLVAYDRVTGNKGAAAIDGVEAKDFKMQLDREWVQLKISAGKWELSTASSKAGNDS